MWNKIKKLWPLIIIALLFSIGAAHASQNAVVLPITSPYPGLTMLNNINSAFNTFQTNFSGNSAPSSPATWQLWEDTTNSILKIYDGANWLPIAKNNGSSWVGINAGVLQLAPSSTGSSNAYVVTYSPTVTAYVTGIHYPFIANFANTTASTENVNGIGAKALKKQGGVALASGDIGNGAFVDTVYDGTNLQITSELGNSAVGTVTNVTCGTGLSGGSFSTSGTCALGTVLAGQVLANVTGSTAVPIGTSLSAILDNAISSTQGTITYRNASTWVGLAPGTSGYLLTSNGAGANPSYTASPKGFTTQNVVTGSRSIGSVYQNTSGKTMMVNVSVTGSTTCQFSAVSDSGSSPSTLVAQSYSPGGGSGQINLVFMVLTGNYYQVTVSTGSGTVASWTEWD